MGPDYSYETDLTARGFRAVAGVDEVGRGPLAGPVVAAAVILDPENIPDGLNDSKALSEKKRNILAKHIYASAIVAIGVCSEREIETLNILRASHVAMLRALDQIAADFALIDGNMMPKGLQIPGLTLIKGDGRSQSIAAASIVAKVWRDRHMVDLSRQFPGYAFEKNKGYPSKSHKAALKLHGVSPVHRRTFKPVAELLGP